MFSRLFHHILLLSSFLMVACGQLDHHREKKIDTALDFLLGNLKTNLEASNGFLTASVDDMFKRKKLSFLSSELQGFVKSQLSGEEIFQNIKLYYRQNVGDKAILNAYKAFTSDDSSNLLGKERGDLNPETYETFIHRWKKSDNLEERASIFDSLDGLSKISESNITMAKMIGISLVETDSILAGAPKLSLLPQISQDGLNLFDLQTRYFTTEVLRFSYQDLSIEELRMFKGIFENRDVANFYKILPNVVEDAYYVSIKRIKSKLSNVAFLSKRTKFQ